MRAGIYGAVLVIVCLCTTTCGQDNIFERITAETAPTRPRIEGAPTNMVVVTRNSTPIMYVASGRLHWYAKATGAGATDLPQWNLPDHAIPQPGGNISLLAATSNNTLYALCREESYRDLNMTLRSIASNGTAWQNVTIDSSAADYPVIHSIYADPTSTRVFAGAGTPSANAFAILYLDGTTLKMLQPNSGILSGAAFSSGTHYLSTRGGGIYSITDTGITGTPTQLADNSGGNNPNRLFMGMIRLGTNIIIAVERGGGLYSVNAGNFTSLSYALNYYATGALALWENGTTRLLVAGIQERLTSTSSTNRYGYVEFVLDAGNSITGRNEGDYLMSIINGGSTAQYASSLGKYPVNHLFQAPTNIDTAQTFFASTQTKGLFSYRERDGTWQWNAQE